MQTMKQLSALFRRMLGFPFPISGVFALCLLLPASCGGDDSSDEGYAAIESASFTFDETTPVSYTHLTLPTTSRV